jgi:hypothetical protein
MESAVRKNYQLNFIPLYTKVFQKWRIYEACALRFDLSEADDESELYLKTSLSS